MPNAVKILLLLALIAVSSVFIVDERERVLVLRLENIIGKDYPPGLHFKIPLIDKVYKFDRRLQGLDSEPQRFTTVEKKFVIVDSYVRWRIVDAEKYYLATRGDMKRANSLIYPVINAKLQEEFAKRSVREVASSERDAIMSAVVRGADTDMESKIGAKIEDVRIKRIDFPPEVSGNVYENMRAERDRVAREFRSRGQEAAEKIRAEADRDRTVILAEAYREAETLRGSGDADAAAIYAKAYGAHPEFYSFTRSLHAYRTALADKDNVLVVKPDSPFFKYFSDPQGAPASGSYPLP